MIFLLVLLYLFGLYCIVVDRIENTVIDNESWYETWRKLSDEVSASIEAEEELWGTDATVERLHKNFKVNSKYFDILINRIYGFY